MGVANQTKTEKFTFLPEGKETSRLIREFDWAESPVGPIELWPQSLKTAINIALNAEIPIVMLWGREGILIYNDAYAVFAGARHPDIFGVRAVDAWPEVADFNRNVIKEGLAGRSLSYHDQVLTLSRGKGPERVWMDLNYSPVHDEAGVPAGVFSVVVEITERVKAERLRKEAEAVALAERQKLDYLFNNAPAYIALLSGPDHVYSYMNPLYARLVGGRMILGLPIRKALPEIADSGIYEILDRVYETGKPYIGNEVNLQFDRSGSGMLEETIFNFVYQPVRDAKGQITDIYVHAIEVTELVNARKRLAESKRKFDALFGSRIVSIAIVDLEGNIHDANRTFLNTFGYSKADLKKGMTSRQITAQGNESITEDIYESLRTTRESLPTEKRYIRKDGTEFPGLVGGAMIPESDDLFISFILDATEIERLKEINKAKDEFVAIASHQLRTPATSVKQYLGVLLDGMMGSLSSDQLQIMRTAYESNERQLTIINDILKTAQMDTGGYTLRLEKVDIVKLVTKVMDQFRPVLKNRGQKFVFKAEQPEIKLVVDANDMAICIANLIENASKYSPSDTTITVKLKVSGAKVVLTVKDQGVGIAQEDQDKIFDKFTRISNCLSDTVSGNGLGLYWVKRIVNLHNGTIKVKSEQDKGTKFIVQLPA